MKVLLANLQKFKSDAAHIKTNPIIPILGNIKFENGHITKNNLKEFIIQQCDEVDKDFLIDEKILFNFLSVASDDITFTITKKKIRITDGKISVSSPTEDIINFPKVEADFENLQNLSEDVLSGIGIASRFIIDDETQPIKSNVFVGNDHICGSDGFIAYVNKVGDVPEIILDKTSASKIGSLPLCFYTENKSYNLFCSGKTTYGFIKPEQKFFDLSPLVKVPDEMSFQVRKESLIKFNDACITSSPAKSITSKLDVQNGFMILSMKDADFSIDVDQKIEVPGKSDAEFGYNPAYMNRLLKAVPDSELNFYQGPNKYFITGKNFTSLIMEII